LQLTYTLTVHYQESLKSASKTHTVVQNLSASLPIMQRDLTTYGVTVLVAVSAFLLGVVLGKFVS